MDQDPRSSKALFIIPIIVVAVIGGLIFMSKSKTSEPGAAPSAETATANQQAKSPDSMSANAQSAPGMAGTQQQQIVASQNQSLACSSPELGEKLFSISKIKLPEFGQANINNIPEDVKKVNKDLKIAPATDECGKEMVTLKCPSKECTPDNIVKAVELFQIKVVEANSGRTPESKIYHSPVKECPDQFVVNYRLKSRKHCAEDKKAVVKKKK